MRLQRIRQPPPTPRTPRSRPRLWPAALVLLLAGCVAFDARPRGADLFDELYERGRRQNGDLRTFTASFTETTHAALLSRPLVAAGTVAVQRPDRVALHYTEPDERTIVIEGGRMTVAWPARGIRQTKDVGAAQRRVQQYFVDSSPGELRAHFAIDTRRAAGDAGYVVSMIPKRKQIREGLARLELAIDPGTLLMRGMELHFPNGDRKVMTFTDVRPNAALDPDAFRLAAPAPPPSR